MDMVYKVYLFKEVLVLKMICDTGDSSCCCSILLQIIIVVHKH
jgi:hypothetical protein